VLVNGLYNNTLSASAAAAKYDTMTATFSGGLGGFKSWNHKEVGGSLMASGTYFDKGPAVGSPLTNSSSWRQSYVGNLSYGQQVSQRLKFSLQQMGGLSDGGFGYGSSFGANGIPGMTSGYGSGSMTTPDIGGASFVDPANNGLVDNEVFSSRTRFFSGGGSLDYRISQRVQVSGWGQTSFVRRSGSLYGLNNYGGGGQVAYDLSPRSSLGVGLQMGTSSYPSQFGNVRNESIFTTFSRQLTASLMISGQAGVGRIRSEFVGAVALPPEVAAILGTGSVLEVRATRLLTPVYSLSLRKSLGMGSLFVAGGRSFSAGNGMVQAGLRDSLNIGYGRAINSRVSTNVFLAYIRMSGRAGVQRVTETAQGGGMLSYRLAGNLSLTGQSGLRYLGVTHGSRRMDVFAGVGLAWSPGDRAFSF